MTAKTILFEGWHAKQMENPEFVAAVEKLEARNKRQWQRQRAKLRKHIRRIIYGDAIFVMTEEERDWLDITKKLFFPNLISMDDEKETEYE